MGIDDTDSANGGCTTFALTEVVAGARERSIDVIGEPRLVRLNPNIPWKTRGNAALAVRLGHGRGRRRQIGEIAGRPVWSYRAASELSRAEEERLVPTLWSRVLGAADRGSATDPALVVTSSRPPAELYWRAVREVVSVSDVHGVLAATHALWRTEGSDRGLIGAAAGIAWPGRRRTWELLAYREASRIGEPRSVDATSVRAAQARWPELFLCYDPRTRRLLVSPHTRCPILYGLRGRTAEAPLRARASIRSEPVDRWLLFRTNQGTGDHLVPRRAAELGPFSSARIDAVVTVPPESLTGGHVRFGVRDDRGGAVECLAFEPTKTLPRVARLLGLGDRLRVWGGRREDPTFRLEGIQVLRLAARRGVVAAPRCPRCHRGTRSLGRARGYRCPTCRRRWPPEAGRASRMPVEIARGSYHPTPSARRHLAPLGPEP